MDRLQRVGVLVLFWSASVGQHIDRPVIDQGIVAGCLNDVVRFAYSRKSGNSRKGPSAGYAIPEDFFWPSPYDFDGGGPDDEEGEDEEEEDDDYSRSND